MKKIKQIVFAVITVFLSLVVIDFALHLAVYVSPRVNDLLSIVSAKIPDARLGNRPNPAYPGHDEKGFRNLSVPETTNIVALGDSQTYGSGVEADQAWPRVLEGLSERSVYNMALGSYGPVHSLLLWDEANAFKPEVIIEGIYSGNDLHDSFSIVYNRGMLPELKTDDKNQQDIIMRAEQAEPIHLRVSKMYRRGKVKSSTRQSMKSWLVEHSKIYGLLRRTQYELSRMRKANKAPKTWEQKWQKAQSFANKHSEYAQAFSTPSSRTIFTSEYRLAALNLEDPRISEGKKISLEAILQMQQLANRDGIRYIVLLIPTKELVFSEQAREIDAASYHTLLKNERLFWQEAKSFFDQHSIEYIDSLQPLQAALEAGPQPYKVSHNGHPNDIGQRAIAVAVDTYLKSEK